MKNLTKIQKCNLHCLTAFTVQRIAECFICITHTQGQVNCDLSEKETRNGKRNWEG
jgi:hypothetical protein